MRTWIAHPLKCLWVNARPGSSNQDAETRQQGSDPSQDDLARLDFLSKVLRATSHHQAAKEDREHGKQDHPIESRSDASEYDLSQKDIEEKTPSCQGRKAVVHGIDRSIRGNSR